MPQTTANKVTLQAGTDPWSLVPNLKTALESSGIYFEVADDTERTALGPAFPGGVKPVPLLVWQTDKKRWYTWDGSLWSTPGIPYHAEYTSAVGGTTGGSGELIDSVFTVDTATSPDASVFTPDTAGKLKVLKDGLYEFGFLFLPSTSAGKTNLQITISGTVLGTSVGGDYVATQVHCTSDPRWLAANTIVSFFVTTTNSVTYGSRVTATKVG